MFGGLIISIIIILASIVYASFVPLHGPGPLADVSVVPSPVGNVIVFRFEIEVLAARPTLRIFHPKTSPTPFCSRPWFLPSASRRPSSCLEINLIGVIETFR
jgi:hypothetical protein